MGPIRPAHVERRPAELPNSVIPPTSSSSIDIITRFYSLNLILFGVRNLTLLVTLVEHLATSSSNTVAVLPGVMGLPSNGLSGNADLVVELINLLEGQTLGLVNEEVDEGDAQETAAEPDEEDLGLEVGLAGTVVDEVGGRVGDGPVEEPVGGGGHTEGLGTGLEREDLASDDPSQGTPG